MHYHDNLFYRLFTYRPREGRSSEEDFLTEAYAAVLISDRNVGSQVLSELCGLEFSSNFRVLTQQQYGADRPDMEFRDDSRELVVFQENKVGSSFEDTQI